MNQAVDDKDLERLQTNILLSHACAAGKALSREQVRAMLLMMLNVVGHGFSAVRLEFMELARNFLNLGITPYVPSEGSVGGLSYITYASMTLLGKGRVIEGEQIIPASEALARHNLKPITPHPREGLGITSTMGPQVGFCAIALYDFIMAARSADLCCTLSFEALQCTDNALRDDLLVLKRQPETVETAAWMRKVLAGSEIMERSRDGSVQDCTAVRIIPHVMAVFKMQLRHTYEVIMREFEAIIDNPVFLPDGTALMGGNWESSYESVYSDCLCVAAVNVAKMINTHMKRLVNTSQSHLPAYLVEKPGINSGFMMVQYVVEGLSADIAQLSNPITAFYTATSAGQEGPNPLADSAALKACQVAEKLKYLISMTMLSAVQALDFIDLQPSPIIGAVRDEIRKTVSFLEKDDVMYERTEAMHRLIDSGALLKLLEEKVGPFTI